jgi:tetratricopeptide (TPR) repeat protein
MPLLVGALLGFIGGYFAGGGGRPAPAAEASSPAAGGDRLVQARKAVEKDPQNPKLLTELGNLCYDRDDWDGAIQAYEKARRKAASDPNLLPTWGGLPQPPATSRGGRLLRRRAADADHWQSLLNLVLVWAFDGRAAPRRRHFED